MAISRMQQPRQMYGLGSLVKKAVRGIKKIVKSPLGKAAVIGGLGMIPFGASKASLFSRLGGAVPGLFANPTTSQMKIDGFTKGFFPSMFDKFKGLSLGKQIGLGLGATAVATPFIQKAFKTGPYEEIEEEVDEFIDPYTAYMMARNRDPYMSFLPNQQFTQSGFYQPAANGGRIGYNNGGGIMKVASNDANERLLEQLFEQFLEEGFSPEEASKKAREEFYNRDFAGANGGRIGYANGEMVEGDIQLPPEAEKFLRQEYQKYVAQGGDLSYPEFKMMVLQQASGEQGPEQEEVMTTEAETIQTEPQMPMMMANGGLTSVAGYGTPPGTNRFNYPSGGVRVGRAEGGLMDLGGMEKDYRAEGGFVPIGKAEKADDVPARLSVNEFVFTADAVRNAGGGDIDKGAEVMENLMEHLEAGGKVSEESQGAQAMYDNMKQLETRVV